MPRIQCPDGNMLGNCWKTVPKKKAHHCPDQELNLCFETYTQQHEMADSSSYYAVKKNLKLSKQAEKAAKRLRQNPQNQRRRNRNSLRLSRFRQRSSRPHRNSGGRDKTGSRSKTGSRGTRQPHRLHHRQCRAESADRRTKQARPAANPARTAGAGSGQGEGETGYERYTKASTGRPPAPQQ